MLFWNFDILVSPILPQIITFLENIHASSCEELIDAQVQVDADCAPSTLICFLARHPAINNLSVVPQPDDGPSTHILPVLLSLHKLPALTCLALSLQAHDASPNYINTILQCVSHCDSVGYLRLSLPPQSHSLSAMIWPGTSSAVRIRHLAIDSLDASRASSRSAEDALALSAVWIEAFPEVKCFSVRGYSSVTTKDLLDIMRKIAAADVKLSVKLYDPIDT
ncbi:hypothetical protein BDR06DRAFT_1003835 [Suillus hirtellus]|nr:hypothetical protein BDR06DRAFT_1003835 [Suillus hirtellus]